MNNDMNNKELISKYVDGEATPEEIKQVEQLIQDEKSYDIYYQELKKLKTTMHSWEDEPLSPDLEQKLYKSLPSDSSRKEELTMKNRKQFITIGSSLIIGVAVIAVSMQTYIKRGTQGRLKSAADDIGSQFTPGNTNVTKIMKQGASGYQPYSKTTKSGSMLHAGMDSNGQEALKYKHEQKQNKGKLRSVKKDVLVSSNEPLGEVDQYEPYYLSMDYGVLRDEFNAQSIKKEAKKPAKEIVRRRAAGGAQTSTYDPNLLAMGVDLKNAGRTDSSFFKSVSTRQISSSSPITLEAEHWGGEGAKNREKLAKGTMIFGDRVESRIIAPMPMPIPDDEKVDNDEIRRQSGRWNTEEYQRIYENEFMTVDENPLSTFSIDVDTASYSNLRRFLNMNKLPQADAVRIEEMVNYFSYNYPKPKKGEPFSVSVDAAICPWNKDHQLARIGIQGMTLDKEEIPPSNLVFLIDVSGSMNQPNKLPLLKDSFKKLVNQLSVDERVAIVVYAGAAGTVLESTPGNNKQKILSAIDRLQAGGSTAGGAGIKLAYKIAKDNYIKGGNNRVILATDGDFNIGVSSTSEMTRLIEEKREEGVFITVLGFGTGNYKDGRMEQIANKGNGNYYYIDTASEADKVLVRELGSTLFTIAKDVKLQIEFNPSQVKAYRLIGYENRMLAKEDFNDDTKDAGELGAGHTVTALYELVPADSEEIFRDVDELSFQKRDVVESNDLMLIKLRYKKPDGNKSKLIKQSVTTSEITSNLSGDFEFVSAVAEFGLLLRGSRFKGTSSYDHVISSARESKGADEFGYRKEFIDLVNKAKSLDNRTEENSNPGIFFKGGQNE